MDNRLRLNLKAIGAHPESKTLRQAITTYLSKLPAGSTEWSEWLEEYTEGVLIDKFGVQI